MNARKQKKIILSITVLATIAILIVIALYHYFSIPPNILLVTVDTLRADHLGYNGYLRDTSPNIDALAKEGVVFNNAYSQAGWTLPSFASIFTSLYPKDHGVTDWDIKLKYSVVTLTETLSENGYFTFGYPSLFSFDDGSGFEQGFDSYYPDVIDLGRPHNKKTSPKVNELILGDLQSMKEPFFIWAHYFDPHENYLNHKGFNFGNRPIDHYDSEIAFTDKHIGDVFAELKRLGLYDNTIIVFVSDHGEEFKDHGRDFHRTLYQEVLKVPLIIKVPGLTPGAIDSYVSHIDIAPTILKLVGIDIPDSFQGRNILSDNLTDIPVFAERGSGEVAFQKAVISNEYKLYQVTIDNADTSSHRFKMQTFFNNENHLFNLANDARERRNLFDSGEYLETRIPLENLISDFYGLEGRKFEERKEFNEETLENLKALGYVE